MHIKYVLLCPSVEQFHVHAAACAHTASLLLSGYLPFVYLSTFVYLHETRKYMSVVTVT